MQHKMKSLNKKTLVNGSFLNVKIAMKIMITFEDGDDFENEEKIKFLFQHHLPFTKACRDQSICRFEARIKHVAPHIETKLS